jgi:hypothetical protein
MKTCLLCTGLVLAALAATLSAAEPADAPLAALLRYQSGADVSPLRHYEALVRQAVDHPATRQRVEADFIRVLSGESTYEAKRFACQQLAVIGGEASVPALAALLKNAETAGIAAAALAQNPAPAASDALRRALGTAPAAARPALAHALGVRGDTKAVAQLNKLARDSDPATAEAALSALAKIATPGAQKTLAELRQDPPPALRRVVAEASFYLADTLARRGNRKAAAAIYQDYLAADQPADLRRGAFGNLLRLDRDGGQRRAVEALRGEDAALKPVAIAAMPGLNNAGASRAFAAVMPHLAPGEQVLLLQALAARGDAPARKAAEEQLGSPQAEVRLAAIAALGQMGDAATVPVLARAVQTARDAAERRAVENALAGLKGGVAVDRALAAQLRNRMAGPKAPFLAALVRRANPDSLPTFLAEATSPDAAMAKLAFQGLSRVAGPNDLPAALKALAGLRAEAALEDAQASLGQLLRLVEPPGRAAAAVREALRAAPDTAARLRLLPLMAFCPDAENLAQVVAAASAEDPALRDTGLRTLADWPDAAAWEPLRALYARAPGETERVLALRGLARLLGEQNARPDATMVNRYRELLATARGDNDRKLILGALAGCAHPEALTLALEQLGHAATRAEAVLAVKKIAEAIKDRHPEAAAAALQKVQ